MNNSKDVICIADYVKLVSKLEESAAMISAAEELMLPTDTMKLMDSYLIGYMRCCKIVVAEAIKAIKESTTYKKTKKKRVSDSE